MRFMVGAIRNAYWGVLATDLRTGDKTSGAKNQTPLTRAIGDPGSFYWCFDVSTH